MAAVNRRQYESRSWQGEIADMAVITFGDSAQARDRSLRRVNRASCQRSPPLRPTRCLASLRVSGDFAAYPELVQSMGGIVP
jgi:hypothetical protein